MKPKKAKILLLIGVKLILIGIGDYFIKSNYVAFGLGIIIVNVIFIILDIISYITSIEY